MCSHLCPVIDESDFTTRYKLHQHGDLSARIEMIQLQAMMFTAIAYATEFQLRQMPFSTVLEGQTALLENVKHLYNHDHSVGHVTRATVCLLLTFWSPYNSDPCVNSFWLDRAFFHAREARLWDPLTDSATPSSQRKVIWWCCLVRDRIIGMGLRRPHRLHTTAHERTWPMVTMADFGSEVICSQYMDRRSKQLRMSSFIWLCHLSIQIVSIIEFQREAMFSRTWRTGRENVSSVTKRIEIVLDIKHRLDVLELQFELDGNLTLRGGDPQVDVVAVKTLQVMIQSLIIMLYRPFVSIHPHDCPEEITFRSRSVQKIELAAAKVGGIFHTLLTQISIEAIPLAIVAWIHFPVAVCLFHSSVAKDQMPQLGAHQRSSIVTGFRALAERHSGAAATVTAIWTTLENLLGRERRHSQGHSSDAGVDGSQLTVEKDASRLHAIGTVVDRILAFDQREIFLRE
ncbi:uncharacterized protein A1O5_11690 [Cladophialophora psammophila CBS 110553]|uniref:Transcription factor domain-containing protein n=1 Tax=Cladophialophora psammophila CBS 110553 TaxID=1182543 RepID=W9WYR6_9EURO|nr:uncharacterized protein A1O5_11690 [Cladophialophora psammophila CBS 110553]EXJ63369.1 hypothetical protein A1O5_11690 [Cladophialophora psammophila CBS 110553]